MTYRNLCSDRYFFLGSENCSQKWDILFNTGSVCKLLQTHYCYQTNNFDSGLQTTPTATVDNSLIGPKNPVMMCLVKSMQWRGGQTVMDLTSVTSFFSYSIIAPDGLVGSISSASPTPTAFPVGVVSMRHWTNGIVSILYYLYILYYLICYFGLICSRSIFYQTIYRHWMHKILQRYTGKLMLPKFSHFN